MPRRAHSVAHTRAARSSPRTTRSYELLGTADEPTFAHELASRQPPHHDGEELVLEVLDPAAYVVLLVVVVDRNARLRDDRPTVEAGVDEVDRHAGDLRAA